MFQVGQLVRCPIDGEMGLVVEKKWYEYYKEGEYWYRICWQGSELRSKMHDDQMEWASANEIVSIEEYERKQKDEESS